MKDKALGKIELTNHITDDGDIIPKGTKGDLVGYQGVFYYAIKVNYRGRKREIWGVSIDDVKIIQDIKDKRLQNNNSIRELRRQ